MKKFILFVIIVFSLTGCTDYTELNDLGIVSSMFIGFEDDKYTVSVEILNTTKESEKPVYYLEATGNTFSESINNLYNLSTTKLFFSRMDSVIIDDNVANSHLQEIYDYLVRDSSIRNDFYLVINDNIEKLKTYESEIKLSFGETVSKIIKKNLEKNGDFYTSDFREVLHNVLLNNTYILGSIDLEDNNVVLKDSYVFKDNKLGYKLSKNEILATNIIKNNISSFIIDITYEYDCYEYKTDIKVKNDNIIISTNLNIRLLNINNINLENKKDLQNLEAEINKEIKDLIYSTIETSILQNVDFLNIGSTIYKFDNANFTIDAWKNKNYKVSVLTTINEKGLTFNTIGENT